MAKGRIDLPYNDIDEAFRRIVEGALSQVWTAMPATVQRHDIKQNTVDALSALKLKYRGYDGKETWVPMPKLGDTPVYYPSGGGVTLTLPVKKDDEGLLVFASRTIDKWWKDGAKKEPAEQNEARMHDFADAFMFPGFRSQPNALKSVSEDTFQIRTEDGKTNFDFSPKNEGQMTLTAPKNPTTVQGKGFDTKVETSNLTSSGDTTVKSSGGKVTLDAAAAVEVTRDLKAFGKIDASGGFFKNGVPVTGSGGGGGGEAGPPGPAGPAGPPGPAGVYTAGPGIQIDTATDPDTITNIGVTNLIAGTNITLSAATGAVTISAAGGGASVSISDVAPASPTTGQLWFDSTQADLYIRYTDQDTSQWVPVLSGPSAGAGIPDDAPSNNVGYGRMNAAWTPVLMITGDVLDGGNF